MAPPGYGGVQVFKELIFLLRSSLQSLGADCIIKANELSEDRVNIVIGYHLLKHGDYLKKQKYIPYQLEQLSTKEGWYSENVRQLLEGAEAIWDYSLQNIQFLQDLGIEARYLPIGYHEDLEIIKHEKEKDIDVLFYGSLNQRRTAIIEKLQCIPGVNMATIYGAFGQERDNCIARAKIVLNMHFYKTAIMESPRISFLLNNACFVVTEESIDDPYCELGIATARYEELVETCRHFLSRPREIELERWRIYNKFKSEFRMQDFIKEVL